MENFLKPFNLIIKTLSPLHIASGDKLTTADFLIDKGKGSLIVIDQQKLLNWIKNQPNVEILAQRLSEALVNRNLSAFLHNHYRDQIDQIAAYRLPYSDQKTPREIREFIKSGRGYPFIPGTSIKGSLRSAWLRGKMIGDQSLIQQAEGLIKNGAPKRTNSAAIQAEVFIKKGISPSKQPNYDFNRLVVIRDSDLFDAGEVLQLSKVQILSLKNRALNWKLTPSGRVMELTVEALKSGLTFSLPVVFQSNLLEQSASELGFNGLQELFWRLPEYCRRTSFDLMEQEVNFYKRHGRTDLSGWYEKQITLLQKSQDVVFILPLGWGSGYDAKTITDLLSEDVFKLVVEKFDNTKGLGKPGRNSNAPWLGKNDSPKSRKVVIDSKGNITPMGWIAARLQPRPEAEAWYEEQHQPYKKVVDFGERQTLPSAQSDEHPKPPTRTPSPTAHRIVEETPIKKTPVSTFSKLPEPGDQFVGKVFGDEAGEILLEIPGIDPDALAFAVISRSDYPLLPKKITSIHIEVVKLREEVKGYWRVVCKPVE